MEQQPALDSNHLMLLTQQGSREAFETLVVIWHERAIMKAQAILHDRMLAEDVAQECFADIYIKRASYHTDFSFQAYLYTLIKNRSIDALRKQKHTPIPVDTLPGALAPDTPESLLIRKDQFYQVSMMLDRLDPVQKQMLLMFAQGQAYRDIAHTLDLSPGQVKIGIFRARKLLKTIYKDAVKGGSL